MKRLMESSIFKGCIVAIWIFVVVISIIIFPLSKNEKTKFDSFYIGTVMDEWKINGEKEVTKLPTYVENGNNKLVTLESKLPKKIEDNTSLKYSAGYSVSTVYIDDKEVFSYCKYSNPLPFGKMTAGPTLLVPLKKAYEGTKIKITMQMPYDFSKIMPFTKMEMSPMYIGDTHAFKQDILYSNIGKVIICTFLFTLTFLSFCFAIYQYFAKTYHSNIKEFLYFSGMSFCAMLWIFTDSNLSQFITDAAVPNAFLSYVSLGSVGIFFMGYCEQMLETGKRWFRYVKYFGCLIPFCICLGYVLNWFDPVEILLATHFYAIVVIISSLVIAIKEWSYSIYSKLYIIGLQVVLIFCAIGLITFSKSSSKARSSYATFFGVGFVVFVGVLLVIILLREVNFIRERLSMEIYKEMAYQDKLTGCGNRAALEIEIDSGNKIKKYKILSLMLIDLNHLKQVNDNIGHDAGDELIKGGAECLVEAFSPKGKVFRLGGDEFAVVVWDEKGKMQSYCKRLDSVIEKYNEEHEILVSIAKGYTEVCCSDSPNFFRDVYRQADHNMYRDKERCHKMLANEVIIKSNIKK